MLIRLCLPLAMIILFSAAGWADEVDIEPRPADPARLAARALVLDVIQAGASQYVAVGERGHVLRSTDGRTWEQAQFVPVQSTLIRVAFAGGRLWAVGHDATIIHSRDLGQTWSIQNFEPNWEMPLLDVHFFDANRGIAVGAFGLYMTTRDGGRNWERFDLADLVTSEAIDWEEVVRTAEQEDDWDDELGFGDEDWDDEGWYDASQDFDRGCYQFMECHLNALLVMGGDRLMIAAERGYGFRSEDGGQSWESFRFPYSGSMFGLVHLGDESVLAFGLRGHVQLSHDFGRNWEILDTGSLTSNLKGAARGPDGRVLIVGAGAARLTFDPETEQFSLREDRLGGAFASVFIREDGKRIFAGDAGLSYE